MNIVFSVLGTVIGIMVIFIFIQSKHKYDAIIEVIDENEYFIKEIFVVGFTLIQWFGLELSSDIMQKKIHKLSELYGAKEARKVALYDVASQLSYTFVFLPIVLLLSVIGNDILILFFGAALVGFLVIYMEYDKTNKLNKRHEAIDREFPHIISQMALLVNAGMPLREAITTSANKSIGVLSHELKVLVDDMDNGIADYVALERFANRCGVDSVRKFSSLIGQNIRKGSAELAASLMELSTEIWRNRVTSVRIEGEKASTKLLIPILMIFIGILVMVVVPMFTGIM